MSYIKENTFFSCLFFFREKEISFSRINVYLFIVFLLALTPKSFAANEAAQTFTLDGTLTQAGTKSALIDSNAKLTISIINPDGTCLLYEESQYINTTNTNGYFNIQVGSPTGVGKRTVSDPGRTMAEIFQNTSAISANSVPSKTCAAGTYTPAAGDVRYFRIIVTPSATLAADTLSPDIIIDSVPQALVAQSLQGLGRSNILQVNNSGSTILTQANLEAAFTTPAYVNLQAILAGNFLSKDTTGAALPVFASNPGGIAAGDLWYDSTTNQVKYYNGTAVQTLGTSGSGISSLTVGSSMSADGTVGGTLSAAGTIDLSNTGVTAGTYPKVTVDAKGRVTTGTTLSESDIPTLSTAGKVSGNAITSGTISGTTAINSSGNLVTTGTVSGLTVQATNLRVYNGANYVQLSAAAMSGDISLTLPATTGSAGQVLSTNGSGILSWISSGLPSLLDGRMWLGNGSNVATAVTMSGDATISNAGILTLNTVSVSKGGTNATSFGNNRIIASNGTGSALIDFTCSLNQVISFDASGNATCANVSALAGMIVNGGNTTSGTISIGTNDNHALQFKTNNTVAMAISQNSSVTMMNGMAGGLTVFSGSAGYRALQLSSSSESAGVGGSVLFGHGQAAATWDTRLAWSAANTIKLDNNTTGGAAHLIVNGNIGIGTGAPLSALDISGAFTAQGMSSAPSASPANTGRIYYDYATNKFKISQNGGGYVDLVGAGSITSLGGQTGASQTFAVGATGTAPNISSASDVHTVNIPMASTASVTAGLLSKTDYDAFTAKLGATAQFAGDVSGTYNATVTKKLQGKDITAASVSGQIMVYNGTLWQNSVVSGDATLAHDGRLTLDTVRVSKGGTNATSFGNNRIIASNGTGSAFIDFTCGLNQVISFDASGNATCSNVSALTAMYLNGGNSFAGSATLGTNDNHSLSFEVNNATAMTISQSGNVGIGTTSPGALLDVASSANGGTLPNFPAIRVLNTNATQGDGTTTFNYSDLRTSAGNGAVIGSILAAYNSSGITNGVYLRSTTSTPLYLQTNAATRMTIDTSGNVGVGISSPATKFDILGTGTGTTPANSGTTDATMNARIGRGTAGVDIGMLDSGTGYLQTRNIANLATNFNLAINPNGGNVGIGTTVPTSILDINGAETMRGMAAPGLSPAGQGRIYYDSTANKYKVSQNGAAYSDLVGSGGVTGSGTTNYIPKFTSATALGNSLITDNGTNVGVGTVLTNARMNVINDGATPQFMLGDSGCGSCFFTMGRAQGGSPYPGWLELIGIQGTAYGLIVKTGGLGVGALTGTPQSKVDILGNVSIGSYAGVTAAPTDGMIVSGNVGIGLTAPSTALHVSGAITAQGIAAPAVSAAGTSRMYFDSTTNKFRISQNGAAYADILTSVSAGGGFVNGGNSFAGSATLGTNDSHSLSFEVNNTTAMTISQNGNVGIGTTAAVTPLEVYTGNALASPNNLFKIKRGSSTNGEGAGIGFAVEGSGIAGVLIGAKIVHIRTAGNSIGDLAFYTNSSGGAGDSSAERMRILSTGNMGIGNVAPSEKLEVTGNIKSTGQMYSGQTVISSGATVDFNTGNVQILSSVGGTAITLNNMKDGAAYTLIIEDATSRQYTFTNCTNSYFQPANAATTASTTTIYTILKVTMASTTRCYISWITGFQ